MAKKKTTYSGPGLDLDFSANDEVQEQKPVTVLGITFENDDERRQYFREQLRAKLPELRKIEGFPIGSDDDIINLSDPPYYTACPNPWLNDFIAEWEQEKQQLEAEGKRQPNVVVNEPYAADISDIKNDSVYRAHTYHTKVPHTIIMRYLLHYTQPGDIVFDGFAGTGMTGLACQSCVSPTDGVISKISSSEDMSMINWGIRHGICGDLSPYASLIAYNYNTPINSIILEKEVNRIIKEMYEQYGWMFKTELNNIGECEVKCVVWSDLYICPNCGHEHCLWDLTVDKENRRLLDRYNCPNCSSEISVKTAEKSYKTTFDDIANAPSKEPKSIPVLLVCVDKNNKRYEVKPSEADLKLISKIDGIEINNFIPTDRLPHGFNLDQPQRSHSIKYFYQFYTKRNLIILSEFLSKISNSKIPSKIKFIFTGMINRSTKMNRVHFTKYLKGGTDWDAGHLKGTLYIPSYQVESSALAQISNKLTRYLKAAPMLPDNYDSIINIASARRSNLADNSVDYIFTDPPFGGNIMYSELNLLPESWLKVKTNNQEEAVINETQDKDLSQYSHLMLDSWKECYRILKPGKWMTVEFSNTSASVWNSIQQALTNAGFVIANVSALNKGQGGIRSITTTTAVKQDLAISCFKPTESLLSNLNENSPETNIWDFIGELLNRLPIHLVHDNKTTSVVERSPKILYDRLISFYVQHGYDVPLNASEFQVGLRERFVERDGMFFTASQAAKYDELRKDTDGFQSTIFFVDSEQGGILWLKNELSTPQTYQEIQPKWMQAINGVRKGDILPELMQILEENFIKEPDGKWRRPNLQDDVDLEALRTKALLREFKVYVEVAQKPKGKIKEARVEALRAGFKQCYKEKDFVTIIAVGNRIPQNLLTEDETLLQFYDIASSRV